MGVKTIVRGLVFQGYSSREPVEAVLVEGDRITYAGSYDEALRVAGGNVRILDYEDHLVTPGFLDSHCHLSVAGLYLETGVSLLDTSSIEEIKEVLGAEARRQGPGKWILGFGLDESRLRESRLPTRWDLDEASPHNPVVVDHISGHLAVANSLALRAAGITRNTPDPPGGIIERSEDGEPTGILRDNAMNLVLRLLPPSPPDVWVRGIERAQRLWIKRGFTGAEDTGTFDAWSSIYGAYKELRNRNKLLMRIRLARTVSGPGEAAQAIRDVMEARMWDDEQLRTNLVKVFYDGSGLARTALLYEDWCMDYKPQKNNRGLRVIEPSDMASIFGETLSRGIRIAVHAIGDRAVDEVADAFSKAVGRQASGCEASIVHAILVSNKGLESLSSLRLCIKTQPGFMYTHGHVYAGNLCIHRAKRAFPLRSLKERGVVVSSSTDAPFVGSPNPVEGLYGAVYRKPARRAPPNVFGSAEALSFPEALETYTRLSAIAAGWSDMVGTLEKDKKADLVVWSLRSLEPGENELLGSKPIMVMINGRVVYSDNIGQES